MPLRVWVYAFWKACAARKESARCSLSREMEITHKSALFVLRRIRHGLGHDADAPKLTGTVEVDETYVGGKPRYSAAAQARPDAARRKIPVVGDRAARRRCALPHDGAADCRIGLQRCSLRTQTCRAA